ATVLGNDALKDFVLEGLASAGVEVLPIIDHARPTTHKNAFVCGDYRLLKVDTLDNRSITDAHAEEIAGNLSKVAVEAVVFSDFRHGIFNRRTIPGLTNAIPRGTFRVAHSPGPTPSGTLPEFNTL